MASSSNLLFPPPAHLRPTTHRPIKAYTHLPFLSPPTPPLSLSSPTALHSSLREEQEEREGEGERDTPSPPSSRDEAAVQAKSCLSSALNKPLNNVTNIRNKKKQTRLRVDIPLAETDDENSLPRLVFDVIMGLPVTKKGVAPRVAVVWPDEDVTARAHALFSSPPVTNFCMGSCSSSSLGGADVAVFVSPDRARTARLRSLCMDFDPRPVVVFNPGWEEGEEGAFEKSFEAVYSFVGIEVKGLLSKRRAAVFRGVEGGAFGGMSWAVLAEDEDEKRGWKTVARFRKRPSMAEVENVLYNLMAANSPITKSVKFIKTLVDNVKTGGGGRRGGKVG